MFVVTNRVVLTNFCTTVTNISTMTHHSFADDLQLQMSAPHHNISDLLNSMQSCISDIYISMYTYMVQNTYVIIIPRIGYEIIVQSS